MSSLTTRHRQPELMDDPDLDPTLHQQALAGLARVHWISGTVSTLWQPIRRMAQQLPEATVQVLDIACGGGDIAIALAKRARRTGLAIEVSGFDISETAIEFASAHAAAQEVDVKFFQANAISMPLPRGYDIMCCSLFLHHLDEVEVVHLLRSMKQSAQRMVLVSDLVRSRWGYILTWCGSRILTRSHICHVDGPLSVRAAFTPTEMLDLAARAELNNAILTRHWPQRFLLTWNHS